MPRAATRPRSCTGWRSAPRPSTTPAGPACFYASWPRLTVRAMHRPTTGWRGRSCFCRMDRRKRWPPRGRTWCAPSTASWKTAMRRTPCWDRCTSARAGSTRRSCTSIAQCGRGRCCALRWPGCMSCARTCRARREAELTVNFFRARAKTDLTNHQARLTWADAVTFLEDFPAAVAILEEGFAATRLPAYRAALARVYVSWYDARKPEKGARQRRTPGTAGEGAPRGRCLHAAARSLAGGDPDQGRRGGTDAEGPPGAARERQGGRDDSFRPGRRRLAARPGRRGARPLGARLSTRSEPAGGRQQPGLAPDPASIGGPAPGCSN